MLPGTSPSVILIFAVLGREFYLIGVVKLGLGERFCYDEKTLQPFMLSRSKKVSSWQDYSENGSEP